MKFFYSALIFFINFGAFATPLPTGEWVLAGSRSCVNGAKINDLGFLDNVSEYRYLIDQNSLLISMKFRGKPIEIEYSLTPTEEGFTQAIPLSPAYGASPFRLVEQSGVLTAYFDDSRNAVCGGGQIATTMKMK